MSLIKQALGRLRRRRVDALRPEKAEGSADGQAPLLSSLRPAHATDGIEALGLDHRLAETLSRCGIHTVVQLSALTWADLQQATGLRSTDVSLITRWLHEYARSSGVSSSPQRPDIPPPADHEAESDVVSPIPEPLRPAPPERVCASPGALVPRARPPDLGDEHQDLLATGAIASVAGPAGPPKAILDGTVTACEANAVRQGLSDCPLELLGLPVRAVRSLGRIGIATVGEAEARSDAELLKAWNFGVTSLRKVRDAIRKYRSGEMVAEWPPHQRQVSLDGPWPELRGREGGSSLGGNQNADAEASELMGHSLQLITQQLECGLLHPKAVFRGCDIRSWRTTLSDGLDPTRREALGATLASQPNVARELCDLVVWLQEREFRVVARRLGPQSETLEAIGQSFGVTRERVRQLQQRARRKLTHAIGRSALLRVQSALRFAEDRGDALTFGGWCSEIRDSGLLGTWPASAPDWLREKSPLDVMAVVCAVLQDSSKHSVPSSLLRVWGKDASAGMLAQLDAISSETKRLVRRHAGHSGAVRIDWLSAETGVSIEALASYLLESGFLELVSPWWTRPIKGIAVGRNRDNAVWLRALEKLSCYCGPLPVQDICGGLRNATRRAGFPVPPVKVMTQVLELNGFRAERGAYYVSSQQPPKLSGGELTVMACFARHGKVVHHSELLDAFVSSSFSYPLLHATLYKSPLFVRVSQGLYTLRGYQPNGDDVERALEAGEKVRVDFDLRFDRSGMAHASLTLSPYVAATGVILTSAANKPLGEWTWHDPEGVARLIRVTETEIRGLARPVRRLGCRPGDRITIVFNTWDRTVQIASSRG